MDQPPPFNPSVSDASARRLSELGDMQPFGHDICESWHDAVSTGHVKLHERALEEIQALQKGERILLLNAPRAGHGKTHLLGRVAAMMKDEAIVISLPWQDAEGATWEGTGRGIIDDLAGSGGLFSVLQQLCGGVNALLLRRLIQTGRIPSTDPAQALHVLSQDPLELFNESGSAHVIGAWFRKHFDQLSKPLASISNVDDLAHSEEWIRAMFEYVEKPGAASLDMLKHLAGLDAINQVPRFLKLATVWKPLVLVADHMDGFYRHPESGVALARMALALSALPGVHVVLSMNQDLWETTFGAQLPSALEDRLNARSVSLRGLNAPDAESLVALRLRNFSVNETETRAFLKFIDLERFFLGRPVGSVSARALLRHAAGQWRIFVQSGSAAIESPAIAPTPAPEVLPAFDAESPEDLHQLAEALERDSGGDFLDLTHPEAAPQDTSPPAGLAPESFLPDDESPDPVSEPHSILGEATPSNFQKLRQMLDKLRVSGGDGARSAAPETLVAPAKPAEPLTAKLTLQSRFETLRREMGNNGVVTRLDFRSLGELVRLAGRRFPVIRYDEVELPELQGRSLPRWNMQGMEIVFGLENFSDARYWKTVSAFVAGRVAELGAAAAQNGETSPRLKLAVFKNDEEGAALTALLRDEVIPQSLREKLDIVHLDTRSLASLYAMRQVVREAETGQIQTDATAVLGALAGELDFFWKRLTRPISR